MGEGILELGGFACPGKEEEVVDRVWVEGRIGGGWHCGRCLGRGVIELWGLWVGSLWRLVMDCKFRSRILEYGRWGFILEWFEY